MSAPDRNKRTVITGMSLITPMADDLDGFSRGIFEGRSAIGKWRHPELIGIDSLIGGDLSDYDIKASAEAIRGRLPEYTINKLSKFIANSPWSTQLTALTAIKAFLDAGMFSPAVDKERIALIIAGHNMDDHYKLKNWQRFIDDRQAVDPTFAIKEFDTDHGGCVSEALGLKGALYTVGGACASGNVGLRSALDEIRYHEYDAVLVVAPAYDFCALTLHSLVMLGAISTGRFDISPESASRPFDRDRNGFLPSHSSAALLIEDIDHAIQRGSRIYAEVLSVELSSNASRSPNASEEHEAGVMERAIRAAGIDRTDIDYVSAHATSTKVGDLVEIRAIRRVFGSHAESLKINALKSMTGHTIWASAIVETIAAVIQMQASRLHQSINIGNLDPEIDLDVCANGLTEHNINYLLNNSFGFSGINSAAVIKRYGL